MLRVKLNVIKHFNPGEWDKDCVCVELACIHHLFCLHAERFFKATEVTIGSASSKVVSFIWHLVMNKMESLLFEWTDVYKVWCSVRLSGNAQKIFPYKLM